MVAVTTRAHVRSLRFFPPMLVATLRVRRQLRATPGLVRWASVIGGPREFWTLTIWSSRHALQEFMRSGAHGELMWRLSRWLDSFWLMRWRPGTREHGNWDGLAFAAAEREEEPPPADVPGFLRAAMSGDGRLTYDASPFVRRSRENLAGAGGAVVRLPLSVRGLATAVRALRRLRGDEALLRVFLGAGRRSLFLFVVSSDPALAARLVEDESVRSAALWAHEWRPENEFGHWDGLRVRTARTRRLQGASSSTPRF